jgi:copper chaperone
MSVDLKITGMTCGHCQNAVSKALKGVQGVRDVLVDLAAGRATVEGDVEPGHLVEAIEEEGYNAQILEIR